MPTDFKPLQDRLASLRQASVDNDIRGLAASLQDQFEAFSDDATAFRALLKTAVKEAKPKAGIEPSTNIHKVLSMFLVNHDDSLGEIERAYKAVRTANTYASTALSATIKTLDTFPQFLREHGSGTLKPETIRGLQDLCEKMGVP